MKHAQKTPDYVPFLNVAVPKRHTSIHKALSGFTLTFFILFSLAFGASAQTSYYVATNGSDSNPGTLAAPFLTLTKAQSAEEAAGTSIHRNIYLRGGSYYNVTILVTPSDNNTAWIGYPGDPPAMIFGGQPLTGWTATSNGMWEAPLPTFPMSSLNSSVNDVTGWEARMLLVDGAMAARAQYPTNGSSLNYASSSTGGTLYWQNSDIPSTMVGANAEVMIDQSYNSTTIPVSSINAPAKTMTLAYAPWQGFTWEADIQTYRVYNTVEGMSRPGQFYFDHVNNVVKYWPLASAPNPNNSQIIVPTTDCVFRFSGAAQNVMFSNLTVRVNALIPTDEEGFGYCLNNQSLFHLKDNCDASGLTWQNCTLGWCAGNAIGGDYSFAPNATVVNSEVGWCGCSGVVLCCGAHAVVSNSYIHDTGLITYQCPGVRVSGTNSFIVQNNLFNFRSSAIANHDVEGLTVMYNSISNCMQNNQDMGAYYQYFGPSGSVEAIGNVIASNLFQMVGTTLPNQNATLANAETGNWMDNWYRPAVYLDQESQMNQVFGNIFINCPMPILWNQGTNNSFVNNVCINANPAYTGVHAYADVNITYGMRLYLSSDSAAPLMFSNNICYYCTNFYGDNNNLCTWNNNIFHSTQGLTANLPSCIGGSTSDPLFTSVPNNLSFQSGSPAPGMGIVPLTFTQQAAGVGSGAALTPAVITWAIPASIQYGTALGANQLNATASVAGTFSYSPALGTVPGAGAQTLSVTFTPSNTTVYSGASASVTLTVTTAPLTITANNQAMLLGGPLPTLTASYSGLVNGDTTASLSTPCTMATTATASSPAGTYPITASGAADPNYNLSYVNGTLTVTATAPTQTTLTWAAPGAITYGTALSAAQLDATASDPGTFNYSPALGAMLAAGSQTLSVTFTPANSVLYSGATASTTLTVQKAPLTITANNLTMPPGGPLPTLTASYSGFVNGDTASSLTTSVTLSTTATVSSPAGTYPITASGAASGNYSISYVGGTLTVSGTSTPTLTWAAPAGITYGAALSAGQLDATASVPGTFTYRPASGAVLATGTQTLSVTFVPSNTALYSSTNASVSLTVAKAPLTITASNASKLYAAVVPTLGCSYAGFVNGDTPASLTTPVWMATAAASNSPVGGYWIAANSATSSNYAITYSSATLTVTPSSLTITANNQSMTAGAALPALTAGYAGFVNGDTSASLTAQPALSTTATSNSVAGTYPITVSGAADANYTIAYVNGTLTVTAAHPTQTVLTWASPASITYGTALGAAQLNASASAPGTIVYSPASGTVLPAGAQTLTAVFTPSNSSLYTGATNTVSLTVSKAPLTITANNASKAYGAALPSFSATYAGFVNGDTAASLTTSVSLAAIATSSSPAGSYSITASGAVDANYTISYASGTLTVTPVPLTITAANQTRLYGAANPAFSATYAGFVNGDTAASLTTSVSLAAIATSSSPAGSYSITASGAVDANYTISYASGTLTVTPVPLTITAANQTRLYGAANPAFSATYAGFVNGDTAASLTTSVSLAAIATSSSPAGSYSITASGAADANYTISYVAGTLTVSPAPLTITANSLTKVQGASLPPLTASYAGFANGDTSASLTTQPILSTTATSNSVAGTYPITVSGAVDANYTISYVNGTLTVTGNTAAAVLTWTTPASITYGTALGAGQLDATANVPGTFVYNPTAGTVLAAGSKTLTVTFSPSNSALYTGATTSVALTVTEAPLTITASNTSKVYGAAVPTLGCSYAGFVNGDTPASLTTPVWMATAAASNSPVGGYWIAANSATSSNYAITYYSATLTVTQAPLVITANNQSMTGGGTLPALTASYSGFVLGNTTNNLTKQPTLSTKANSSSRAGKYAINVSGASATNYSISYVSGILTITSSGQITAAPLVASGGAVLLPGGQMQISLSGQAGQMYVLDASSDLINWIPVVTNSLSAANDTFLVLINTNTTANFYQVDPSNP